MRIWSHRSGSWELIKEGVPGESDGAHAGGGMVMNPRQRGHFGSPKVAPCDGF